MTTLNNDQTKTTATIAC